MKKLYCTFLTYFSIWNKSFLGCTAYGTPCIFLPEDSRNSKTRLPFSSQAKRRSINARALSLAKVQDVIGIKKNIIRICLLPHNAVTRHHSSQAINTAGGAKRRCVTLTTKSGHAPTISVCIESVYMSITTEREGEGSMIFQRF